MKKRDINIKEENKKIIKLFLLQLFILLFSSVVFAQQSQSLWDSQILLSLRNVGGNWYIICLIAVGIAYCVVGLIYMFGKGIGSSEFVAWANNEFYQITATLLILIIVFSVTKIEDEVYKSFGYTGPSPAIDTAKSYLSDVRSYVTWRFIAAFTLNVYLQIAGDSLVSLTQFEYFNPTGTIEDILSFFKNDVVGIAITSFGVTFGVTAAQEWVLEIISLITFTIILPLGIFLRAVPFFRKVGSILIAVAIGLYIVYPLTFLLDIKIIRYIKNCDQDIRIPCRWAEPSPTEIVGELASLPLVLTKLEGNFGKIFGRIMNVRLLSGASVIYAIEGINLLSTSLITDGAFGITILGLFLPALNVVITFGVIRHLAGIMGTDVSLRDLMKIL